MDLANRLPTTKALTVASLVALALGAGAAGCGDDGGKQSLVPTTDTYTGADSLPADTSEPADTEAPVDTATAPDTTTSAPNTLRYDPTMKGDDGLVCVTSPCVMSGLAGAGFDLAVIYRDGSGKGLADRSIKFESDAPQTLAALSALTSYTDESGVATVHVRSFDVPGTATITASVGSDPGAGSVSFVITLTLPPAPVLVASPEYVGHLGVADFRLNLYLQHDGEPSCAAVYPDAGGVHPTPDLTTGPYGFGEQASLLTLPGLVEAGEQRWTLQFTGPTDGVTDVAEGCVDNVLVKPDDTASELVYVLDLPPRFKGTYRTETRMDVVSGAEGTTGSIMHGVTQLFTHPGALVISWACQNASGFLGTVCGYLQSGDGSLSVVGAIVADFADASLLELLANTLGQNVTFTGTTVSEILQDLRFMSTMPFLAEPATSKPGFQGAYFAPGDASETWTHVRFRWKFDPACKNVANPLECGWTSIPLESIYGYQPQAQLAAGVDANLALHIEEHEVTGLTYGPLIDAILERYILPLAFGDGTGGLPPVDSFEDLASVLLGDRECLYYDDCCDIFTARIEDSVPSYVAYAAPYACDAAIPVIGQTLRNQLLGLDGAMNLGTPAGQGCQAVDGNADRWIDAWGRQSALCAWHLFFPMSDGPFEPDTSWLSALQ